MGNEMAVYFLGKMEKCEGKKFSRETAEKDFEDQSVLNSSGDKKMSPPVATVTGEDKLSPSVSKGKNYLSKRNDAGSKV